MPRLKSQAGSAAPSLWLWQPPAPIVKARAAPGASRRRCPRAIFMRRSERRQTFRFFASQLRSRLAMSAGLK